MAQAQNSMLSQPEKKNGGQPGLISVTARPEVPTLSMIGCPADLVLGVHGGELVNLYLCIHVCASVLKILLVNSILRGKAHTKTHK